MSACGLTRSEVAGLADVVAVAIGEGVKRQFVRPRSQRADAVSALFDGQERAVLAVIRVRAGQAIGPGWPGVEVHVDAVEVIDPYAATVDFDDAVRSNGAGLPNRYGQRETWPDRMESA